jgi:hypothetical protein
MQIHSRDVQSSLSANSFSEDPEPMTGCPGGKKIAKRLFSALQQCPYFKVPLISMRPHALLCASALPHRHSSICD